MFRKKPAPPHSFSKDYEDTVSRLLRLAATTERLRIEQERKAKTIIDAAFDAYILINRNGYILEWNVAAEKMFGWSRDEAISQSVTDLIVPERYRSRHEKGMAQFANSGGGRGLNIKLRTHALHRDGTEFPVELLIRPMVLHDEYVAVGFIRDLREGVNNDALVLDDVL